MASTAHHPPITVPIRFFATPHDSYDSVEVTQSTFEHIAGGYEGVGGMPIEYERHTIFASGVNQIVLTIHCEHEEQFDPTTHAMEPAPGETQPRPKYETKQGEPT